MTIIRRLGLLEDQTDINGHKTEYYYDHFNRLILTQLPNFTWTKSTLDVVGTNSHKPTGAVYVQESITSDAENDPSYTFFDKLMRVIRTATPSLDGTYVYVDQTYNSIGQRISSTEPYFSGGSVYLTNYHYDSSGRLYKVEKPNGAKQEMVFDGLKTITKTYRESGVWLNTTKYVNGAGQLLKTVDHDGHYIRYEYDPFGNLTKTYEPDENSVEVLISESTYDKLGRVVTFASQDMGFKSNKKTVYSYYATGEVKTVTDPKGQIVTNYYDDFGRLTDRTRPSASGTSTDKWEYDNATKGKGLISKTIKSDAVTTETEFFYDFLSRNSKTTQTVDGQSYQTMTSYDNFSRTSHIHYPNGFSVQHNYNSRSFLTDVKNAATTASYWTANEMNARGQLKKYTLGNSLITEMGYKIEDGTISSIQTGTSADPISIQNLSYTFDYIGNLKTRSDNKRSLSECM